LPFPRKQRNRDDKQANGNTKKENEIHHHLLPEEKPEAKA